MKNKVGYYHKRLDTGEIFYVGIGTPSRPYEDKHRNNHWNHIVEKVDYEVILVEENLSWEEACEWEKFEIKRIGRRDLGMGPLVNMTDGGEGTQGVLITEERRVNISLATKEAMSNPEVQKRLSESHLGIKPWNTGKSVFVGEENPNFGNKWSDEQKNQMSEKLKETYKDGFSDEHLDKLKEKRKGRKPAAKLTKENIISIRESFDRNQGHTYKQFAEKYNVTSGSIRNVILGISWQNL
jgi:hypothetical protein